MTIRMILVPGPEIIVVGDQSEFPPRHDHPMERPHRLVLNHPSLVMTRLGPGIAEVEMDDLADLVRESMAHDLRGIIMQHPDVLHRMASHAIRRVSEELPCPFDSQMVGLRLQHRLLNQERPLARADLEFEATVWILEERPRIPRPVLERRQVAPIKTVSIELQFSTTAETERHDSLLEDPRLHESYLLTAAGTRRMNSAIFSIGASSMVMSMIAYSSTAPVVVG